MPFPDDEEDVLLKQQDEQDEPEEQEEPESPPEPEEVEAKAEEPEDESDERKEEMGKRAQKRINQLLARAKAAEEATEELRNYLSQRDQEFEELRKKVEERDTRSFEQTFEQKQATLKARKKQALEDGDYDAVIQVDDDLRKLETERAKHYFQSQQQRREPPTPPQPQARVTDAEREWQERNPWFVEETQQGKVTKRATTAATLYQALLDRYDPDDERLYQVLDQQLHGIYPELAPQRRRQTSPVSTGSRVVPPRQSKGRLTDTDLTVIKELGIGDPRDPKVQAAYAKYREGRY